MKDQSKEIELVQRDGEVLVDSRIVAKGIGVEHRAFVRTLRKYQSELEEFGILRFENAKPSEVSAFENAKPSEVSAFETERGDRPLFSLFEKKLLQFLQLCLSPCSVLSRGAESLLKCHTKDNQPGSWLSFFVPRELENCSQL